MNLIKSRLKKTFLELIAIDGVYPQEENVIAYVIGRLKKARVKWQQDYFGNIIVKIPGKGSPMMLSTHVDIPEPVPQVRYIIDRDIIRSDGSCILGADPKTGLAILIELIDEYAKKGRAFHTPLEVVFTRGEEAGLFGAKNLDYSLLNSKVGIVLDEDGPVTQVVTQAPAYARMDGAFIGKIVHPREPEKGVNALRVACEALNSIPWGYSQEGVTWNVGLLKSGTARNSVPGKTTFHAELRSYDTSMVASESERISGILNTVAQKHGAVCELDREIEFEGYTMENSHPLFKQLEKTFEKLKLKANYFSTFGGSDANIFNSRGITSMPIGSGYYNAHEYTEYADVGEMEKITNFLRNFIQR